MKSDVYLETLPECISCIASQEEDLKLFFQEGLKTCDELLTYNEKLKANQETATIDILNTYKKKIYLYNYSKHRSYKGVKSSTLKRNEIFAATISRIILAEDNSHFPPLLVVCGIAHLKGFTAESCGSFVSLLMAKRLFRNIERMDKDGRWITLD